MITFYDSPCLFGIYLNNVFSEIKIFLKEGLRSMDSLCSDPLTGCMKGRHNIWTLPSLSFGMTGWSLKEGLDDNNKNFYLLLEVSQRSFLKKADN